MGKTIYAPGETVRKVFTTTDPSTGAAANASSTPTGALNRNGVLAATPSVAVTVAAVAGQTGVYMASCTLPSGGSAYAVDDDIDLMVTATVAGVTATANILSGRIGYPVATDSSGRVTQAPTDKTGYSLSTAPPTAATVATAVRAELSTELGRLDAAVSSVNTNVDASETAVLNAIGNIPETDLTALTTAIGQVKTNTDKLGNLTASQLEIALKQFTNRVTVIGNTMTVYANDGTTILETFTLTPISGNAGYSERTP